MYSLPIVYTARVSLQDISFHLQEFWTQWDTYRLICETSRHPEFLLLLERWQQLKLVEILPLLK